MQGRIMVVPEDGLAHVNRSGATEVAAGDHKLRVVDQGTIQPGHRVADGVVRVHIRSRNEGSAEFEAGLATIRELIHRDPAGGRWGAVVVVTEVREFEIADCDTGARD